MSMSKIFSQVMFIIGMLAFGHFAFAADKFVNIADIHFSPFSGCENTKAPCIILQKLIQHDAKDWQSIFTSASQQHVATYGEETNNELFESLLAQLKVINQREHPAFVLVLGDFLAHHFHQQYKKYSGDKTTTEYQAFVRKTLQYITLRLNAVFPAIDIYPMIGNNDGYNGDYRVIPNGIFLKDMMNIWVSFIKKKSNKQSFSQEFPYAGFYAAAQNNYRILVLDSVLFSTYSKKSQADEAAQQELQWLHQQLLLAQNQHQKVLLAFHIPAGIDVFRTIKNFFGDVIEFWQPDYQQAFMNELKQFPHRVAGIFSGHIHMDGLQLIELDHSGEVAAISTPSISPIFGNNPGIKVFSYNPVTSHIENYETYFYPLNGQPLWKKEYSFNKAYQMHCRYCSIAKTFSQLMSEENFIDHYKSYYAVSHDAQPITQLGKWVYYQCNLYYVNKSQFISCLHK